MSKTVEVNGCNYLNRCLENKNSCDPVSKSYESIGEILERIIKKK